jgi:hypothetical protein
MRVGCGHDESSWQAMDDSHCPLARWGRLRDAKTLKDAG